MKLVEGEWNKLFTRHSRKMKKTRKFDEEEENNVKKCALGIMDSSSVTDLQIS